LLHAALENRTASFKSCGQLGSFLPFVDCGFFQIHMFARRESRGCQGGVQVIGGGDDNRIDAGQRQRLFMRHQLLHGIRGFERGHCPVSLDIIDVADDD
jgi:hypothetical protein